MPLRHPFCVKFGANAQLLRKHALWTLVPRELLVTALELGRGVNRSRRDRLVCLVRFFSENGCVSHFILLALDSIVRAIEV